MAKVLLTGWSGLIGSAVCRHLSQSHQIIRVGRSPQSDIQIDLARELLDGGLPRADVLVHCAGVTDEEVKVDLESAMDRSKRGSDRLARASIDAGVEALIYISSTHVYGAQEGTMSENRAGAPASHYAWAHLHAEQAFKVVAREYGQRCGIFRPNAVFGSLPSFDHFNRWSLIPFSFPRELVEHQTITLRSDGLAQRNFVSSDHIARCIGNWIDSGSTQAAVHPIGATTESVRSFAERCISIWDKLALGRRGTLQAPALATQALSPPFELHSEFTQIAQPIELQRFLTSLMKTLHEHQPTA